MAKFWVCTFMVSKICRLNSLEKAQMILGSSLPLHGCGALALPKALGNTSRYGVPRCLSVPRPAPSGTGLWWSPHHTTERGPAIHCPPRIQLGLWLPLGRAMPEVLTDSQKLGKKKEKEDQQRSVLQIKEFIKRHCKCCHINNKTGKTSLWFASVFFFDQKFVCYQCSLLRTARRRRMWHIRKEGLLKND